jgi:hypothetical protein
MKISFINHYGHGHYGYIVQRKGGGPHILCAKASMLGATVSVHRPLLDEAITRKLAIIMGIKDGAKFRFYRFLARDILANTESVNSRNGADMVNFSIKLGVNIEKLAPTVRTPEQQASHDKILNHPVTQAIIKEFGATEVQSIPGE